MGANLSTILPKFSDSLVRSWNFEYDGEAACQKAYGILRHNRRDVVQWEISGNMGKRIVILDAGEKDPDFDIVVYLSIRNPSQLSSPPFKNILSEFETIFRAVTGVKIVATNPGFICIEVDGFKINVIPAILFNSSNRYFGPSQDENQKTQTLKLTSGLPNPRKFGHHFSPGLTQSAILYIKKEAERLSAYPLIRLAKFWHRNLGFPRRGFICLTGQSYLLERMAIHVLEKAEKESCGNLSLLSQLEKFFLLISNPGTRIFHPWNEEQVRKIWGKDRYDFSFPLILDPVNPYHNIAFHHQDPVRAHLVLKIYVDGAKKCLDKLDRVREKEEEGQHIQTEDQVRQILDQSNLTL